MNVGWVAARNSVIGLVLGAVALWAHRTARSGAGRRSLAWVGLPAFGLALLANEGAVVVLAYLAAFALIEDRRPRRFLALAPFVALVVVWRVWSSAGGFGAAASGMYLEPHDAPLEYLGRTFVHGTLLLAARFGIAVVDGLGAVPGAYSATLVVAVPFVAGVAWLVGRRARADRTVRAWALGTLGSIASAGALVPTDRGLLAVGLGASFLIADLVVHGLGRGARRVDRGVAVACVGLHLVLSPALLPLRTLTPAWVQSLAAPLERAIPEGADVTGRSIVMLQVPSDLVALYTRAMRDLRGAPGPARITYLYAGPGSLDVERPTEDVLVLRSSEPWLAAPLDRMFRRDVHFEVGERVVGACFDAVVDEVDGGLPRAVRFELHRRGDACALSFMAWSGSAPVPFELPAVGGRAHLPPAVLGPD